MLMVILDCNIRERQSIEVSALRFRMRQTSGSWMSTCLKVANVTSIATSFKFDHHPTTRSSIALFLFITSLLFMFTNDKFVARNTCQDQLGT